MYDDIVKYIPYGRENAISRDDLAIKVGCSDRIMRDLISKARKKTVIINIQNGSGYYRPTEDDMEDVLKYKHQEENRATEVFGNLQPVREFIRKYGKGKEKRKCDSCLYGEKLYDGTLICQHIVSMQGKEATQDYVICNSVAKCDFFLETNIKCSDCKGSCYAIQRKLNCKKMEVLKNEKSIDCSLICRRTLCVVLWDQKMQKPL